MVVTGVAQVCIRVSTANSAESHWAFVQALLVDEAGIIGHPGVMALVTAYNAIVDAEGDISNDLKSSLVVILIVVLVVSVVLHGIVVSPAEVGSAEGERRVGVGGVHIIALVNDGAEGVFVGAEA